MTASSFGYWPGKIVSSTVVVALSVVKLGGGCFQLLFFFFFLAMFGSTWLTSLQVSYSCVHEFLWGLARLILSESAHALPGYTLHEHDAFFFIFSFNFIKTLGFTKLFVIEFETYSVQVPLPSPLATFLP